MTSAIRQTQFFCPVSFSSVLMSYKVAVMNKIDGGLIAMVVAMSLFVGCGEDAPPGSYTLDEFRTAVSEQTCIGYAACDIVESVDDCAGFEYPLEGMFLRYPELKFAVEAETVVFDGEAAFACAAALGTRSCERLTFSILPEACQLTLQGTSDENEECFIQQECTPGLTCNSANFPTCEAGICLPTPPSMRLPQPGEECIPRNISTSIPCTHGYGCVDEVCVVLPVSGEDCDFLLGCGDLSQSCTFDTSMPDSSGVCMPAKRDGVTCQQGECLQSYRCIDSICQPEGGSLNEACGIGIRSPCLYPLECKNIDGQETCVNRTEPLQSCGS